jgi:hypothetical protein
MQFCCESQAMVTPRCLVAPDLATARSHRAVHDEECDRIAPLMGDKSIMIMRAQGLCVVGPTFHNAFDDTCEGGIKGHEAAKWMPPPPQRLQARTRSQGAGLCA